MKVTVNIIINFNQKTVKMEKKNFLFYETPEMEVLMMEIEGSLLDGSPNMDNPLDDSTGDTEEME